AALLSPPFRKSGSPKAKYSRDLGAIVLLLAACASLFGVKEYNGHAFIAGWLISPLLLAMCIAAKMSASAQTAPNASQAPGHVPQWQYRAETRFLRVPFIFVSNVGVACYPIYLFQESDRLLGVQAPWLFSLLWALAVGFLVHNQWERRFYVFPSYQYSA
ncbi:MAG: hypothetical protein IT285_03535, partial [Bdellovibrionales bacterium]|nr:hypothetical protein [Bdellovibrionales bacterium]